MTFVEPVFPLEAYFISYHDAVSTPEGRGTSGFTTSFPKAESMMESL